MSNGEGIQLQTAKQAGFDPLHDLDIDPALLDPYHDYRVPRVRVVAGVALRWVERTMEMIALAIFAIIFVALVAWDAAWR